MPLAGAPPVFCSASGYVAVLPAGTGVSGPLLLIDMIGRSSVVLTDGAEAVTVPPADVPLAVAVAFSTVPSIPRSRVT